MKSFFALVVMCLLSTARAVDMSQYSPGPGVEPAFKNYLQQLYNETEILNATTQFTNYFYPPGTLIVLNTTSVGPKAILHEKHVLLPPHGNKTWNHHPNVTTVVSNNSTTKVYQVLGIIISSYKGGNCSAAYFSSHFTVKKEANGSIDLQPHAGNLLIYDDYVVNPPYSPTDIPCEYP